MFKTKFKTLYKAVAYLFIFLTFGSYTTNKEIERPKTIHYMGMQKLEVNTTTTDLAKIFENVDSNLVKIFYNIQSEYGDKINVTWGFRDRETNKKVGGAKNSSHLYGKALDLTLDSPSREKIKKLIKLSTKYNVLGIGVYSDAKVLHIDIDSTKGRRAWGSSYSCNSIPKWAMNEVKTHLSYIDTLKINTKKSDVVKTDTLTNLQTNRTSDKKLQNSKQDVKEVEKPIYYKVKKGDTLYSISKEYNTSVNILISLNKIVHNHIEIGQKLRIK